MSNRTRLPLGDFYQLLLRHGLLADAAPLAADLLAELCQELCRRSPASRAILSRWAGELAQGAGEKPAAPPRKSKAVKV